MLSSCLMTSSTLQSKPPWRESRFRSRSLGMGPLLFRAPISCDIICDAVGAASEDAPVPVEDDELLSPCASAARSSPEPPLPNPNPARPPAPTNKIYRITLIEVDISILSYLVSLIHPFQFNSIIDHFSFIIDSLLNWVDLSAEGEEGQLESHRADS